MGIDHRRRNSLTASLLGFRCVAAWHDGRVDRLDLEARLATFGASVGDRLTDDQRSWFAEFIDAGEYGIALEMLADWLSEAEAPMFQAERTEAEALSKSMGNEERVLGPLNLCPDHPG